MSTLKDISRKVGVSPAAVSRVLNDMPIRIAELKRRHIRRVARELQYRPNTIAQSLRTSKTQTVGVVVPGLNSAFYPDLIQRLEAKLSTFGLKVIICDSNHNPQTEVEHLQDLLSRRVDGLIVSPARGNQNIEFLRQIQNDGPPLILMDRYYGDGTFSFVTSDNKNGARMGIERLSRLGVRRVMYIGESCRNEGLEQRLEGVREEAAQRGMTCGREDIFLGMPDADEIDTICDAAVKTIDFKTAHKTAVFLEANRFFLSLLRRLHARGLSVPDDLAAIGFDPIHVEITERNFAVLQSLRPPLAVIRQDMETMGAVAGEYITNQLREKQSERLRAFIPTKIVSI